MLKTVGFPSTRTGDQTIVSGNLVIGTAGQGIDFSADPSAAGMTSELLNDYEEGTWTPASGTGVLTNNATARYTKIGRSVTVFFDVNMPTQTDGNNAILTGLPFSFITDGFGVSIGYTNFLSAIYMGAGYLAGSTFSFSNPSGSFQTYTNVSGKRFAGSCTYFV